MAKLFFNTRDELTCIDVDMIAAVQANGNYSRIVYITKREVNLSVGISKLEKILKTHNNRKTRFVRLSRSLIINHAYLHKIDLPKQLLILSDNDKGEIRALVPKDQLRAYKNTLVQTIKSKEENANNHIG